MWPLFFDLPVLLVLPPVQSLVTESFGRFCLDEIQLVKEVLTF